MEFAVVLLGTQGSWQQRFRDLKLIKSNILQYILKTDSFIPNTPPKLKALKNTLIKQQNFFLFITLYNHYKYFAALYFRCKPPVSRRSLFSRIHINSVALRTACFRIAD